jgi:hypothetical protein
MLPNEAFALACRAYYEEQGLIVDEANGEFAHCPYPKSMGDKGYYLLHEHHQQQGLLQSKDVGRKCFFSPDVRKWLLTADYFPDNFFELWDIYTEFAKPTHDSIMKGIETRTKKGYRMPNIYTPERNAKVAKSKQKPVEITFPDGRIGVYPSLKLAGLALGLNPCCVGDWVRKGSPVTQKKYKGYSARYV